MTVNLTAALGVAELLARRVGALLKEAVQHPRQIDYKGVTDLVTDSDRAGEAIIVAGLRDAFPDHGIIGEEGSRIGSSSAEYFWHLDPLDGTTNFAHGIPHFSTSIGLAGPDGRPVVGVVYDALRDECFSAIKGHGATLNGKPIHVSTVSDLSKAQLCTGFSKDRWTNPDNNLEEFSHMLVRAQAVSRLGSAALDLCYVAAGRLDGFWEMRMESWDVMAGLLIVTEAGGQVSNYHGQTDKLYEGKEVVSSNGLLHDRMLMVLTSGDSAPRPGDLDK